MGIVLAGVISLGFFMQSCSKEDSYFSDVASDVATVNSTETNNSIVSEYLQLTGNQYVLNLSEKEAIACGGSVSVQFIY